MSPSARIRIANADELDDVAALLNRHGGHFGDRLERCRTYLNDDDHLLLVAEQGGYVVGASVTAVIGPGGLREELPPDTESLYTALLGEPPARRIGLISLVAVEEEARRQGVGAAITRRQLDWLRDLGVDLVIAFAWHGPDGIAPALGLLQRAGLRPVIRVEGFWRHSPGESACPKCGYHRCECAATVCRLANVRYG